MRIVTNHKLVRRNKRIAQYLFFFSFIVLIASFILANQQALNSGTLAAGSLEATLLLLLPALVLPVGVITSIVSVRMTNLWIRLPRPETAIEEGLKGLSNKSVLYNYYHFPARHVLVCPQGVYAMATRFQDGRYTVQGDEWQSHGGAFSSIIRFFRRDAIRDPGRDAHEAAEAVKKALNEIAPEVEVRPLVIFTDPRASLTINDPAVPVLYADPKQEPNLKDFMRAVPQEDRQMLTAAQIEAFEGATLA